MSPVDLQMRALLARTAMGLGDYGLAIEHFQGILLQESQLSPIALDPKELNQRGLSQIMAELAQALFLQADNRIVPIVQSLIDQTLKLEPTNTIALGLAGIGAFQSEKFQQAINFWQQAIVIQGPNSPNSIALQRGITAAQQSVSVETTAAVTPGVQSSTQPATQKQQQADSVSGANVSGANVSETNVSEPSISGPSVRVSVSLAKEVKVAPETTVFIYARAWQGAKIPLSIARIQASQLPMTLTLTNAMSMAPNMNLTSASQLELVARVSASGAPVPQSGDWQATLGPIETSANNAQPYPLLISEQIP
jgi:cytochrome c-type biogenesis protein CcmH